MSAAAVAAPEEELQAFKFTLRSDERSRLFKPGYRCPQTMTYLELCEYMTQESNKAGFDPLRPKIVSKRRLLDYVIFYCVHSRDHPDQSREAKGLAPAQSKRPDRSEEGTRCLYTGCKFEIRMRRSNDVVLAEQLSAEELKAMKETTKFVWYVDSKEDQMRDDRKVITDCNCFTHTGHPRRSFPLSDVTDAIRKRIHQEATNNVTVASIQSIILQVFKVMLSDFQVRCVMSDVLEFQMHVVGFMSDVWSFRCMFWGSRVMFGVSDECFGVHE
jgi:hypothetical protein